MSFTVELLGSALALLAAMVVAGELGRRLGLRRAGGGSLGVVDGAIFALLGLVLALTFSHSLSRFDLRRDLVAAESNAIGTAWLRLDLLPPEPRGQLQSGLRNWLDARLASYRNRADAAALQAQGRLQDEIWSAALVGAAGAQATQILLLPALNQMFDSANARDIAANSHPPVIVYVLLAGLALLCALLAGYGMAREVSHDWLRSGLFALVSTLAVYVILDMEYPRDGLVRISGVDEALVQLRASMR